MHILNISGCLSEIKTFGLNKAFHQAHKVNQDLVNKALYLKEKLEEWL